MRLHAADRHADRQYRSPAIAVRNAAAHSLWFGHAFTGSKYLDERTTGGWPRRIVDRAILSTAAAPLPEPSSVKMPGAAEATGSPQGADCAFLKSRCTIRRSRTGFGLSAPASCIARMATAESLRKMTQVLWHPATRSPSFRREKVDLSGTSSLRAHGRPPSSILLTAAIGYTLAYGKLFEALWRSSCERSDSRSSDSRGAARPAKSKR